MEIHFATLSILLAFICQPSEGTPWEMNRLNVLRKALRSAAILDCFINGLPTTTSSTTSTTTTSTTTTTEATSKSWGDWDFRSKSQIFQQCADNALQVVTIQGAVLSDDDQKTAMDFLTNQYETLIVKELPLDDIIAEYNRSIVVNF